MVSANFSGCPIDTTELPVIDGASIYQSPLINCTIANGFNFLAPRQENATIIMDVLYIILYSFDLNSTQEHESLIKFISSPSAQKALKWLSKNIEEPYPAPVGEEFVLRLNNLFNKHMFYLKGVCKELTQESQLASLPPPIFLHILSNLKFNDIFPIPDLTIEDEAPLLGYDLGTIFC